MSDEERRTLILEAEEAIRGLAGELSVQSKRAAAVEEARRELAAASRLLERTNEQLQQTSAANRGASLSLQESLTRTGAEQDEALRAGLRAIESRLSELHATVLDDGRKAQEAMERLGHALTGEVRRRLDDAAQVVRESSTELGETVALLQDFHSAARQASEALSRDVVRQALAELKAGTAQLEGMREQMDARLVPAFERSGEAAIAYEKRVAEIQRWLDAEREVVESLRSIDTRIGRGIESNYQRLVKQLADSQRALRIQLWMVGAIAAIGTGASVWLLVTGRGR